MTLSSEGLLGQTFQFHGHSALKRDVIAIASCIANHKSLAIGDSLNQKAHQRLFEQWFKSQITQLGSVI